MCPRQRAWSKHLRLRFCASPRGLFQRAIANYLFILKMKYADLTNGHTVTVASDTRGSGLPQVIKTLAHEPEFPLRAYIQDLRLWVCYSSSSWGKPSTANYPASCFVALPDKEETVVAGVFSLALPSTDPNQVPDAGMMAPTATPTGETPAEKEAFRRRYGR